MSRGEGLGPPMLHRSDSTIAAAGLKELIRRREAAKELSKSIVSLIHYLELEKEERVHFCLAKSGKRKEWEGWTMGKPAAPPPAKIMHMSKLPRGLESMAGMPSLKAAQRRANSIRLAWEQDLQMKRWEAQHWRADKADAHLQAVFEVHHDRILAYEKGVTAMSEAGFLTVLRECTLLDNATAPTDADAIFNHVAQQRQQERQQQQTQPHQTHAQSQLQQQKQWLLRSNGSFVERHTEQALHIDYEGFIMCLTLLAKQRRDAAQPRQPWDHKPSKRRLSDSKARQEAQQAQHAQQAQQMQQAASQQLESCMSAGTLDGRALKAEPSALSTVKAPEAERDTARDMRKVSSSATAKSIRQRMSGPSPEALYQALLRQYVIPLASTDPEPEQDILYDALFAPDALAVLRQFDDRLRALFSWYSTLDDPRSLTWDKIVDFKITLGPDQFILMLINFKVVPVLMSRQDAFQCCDQCFSPEGLSSLFREMSYAGFLLCLAACAAFLPGTLAKRIHTSCTPEELHQYKRYLVHTDSTLQVELEEALQHMEAVRRAKLDDKGRQASGKDFYQFQGERYQAATAQHIAETDLECKLAVLNRREEARQALALTRLKNFYADVRSAAVFDNLRSSKHLRSGSPGGKARKASSAGAAGSVGANAGLSDEEVAPKTPPAQPVAFFSDSMQIKTPKLPHYQGPPSSSYPPGAMPQPAAPWAHALSPRPHTHQAPQALWASTPRKQRPLHDQLLLSTLSTQGDVASTALPVHLPADSYPFHDQTSKRDQSWTAVSPKPPPALNSLKNMAARSSFTLRTPVGASQQVRALAAGSREGGPLRRTEGQMRSFAHPETPALQWVPSKKASLVEQQLQLLAEAAEGSLPPEVLIKPDAQHLQQQQQQLQQPQLSDLQAQRQLPQHPRAGAAPHRGRLRIEARDESEVLQAFTATLPSINAKPQRPFSQPQSKRDRAYTLQQQQQQQQQVQGYGSVPVIGQHQRRQQQLQQQQQQQYQLYQLRQGQQLQQHWSHQQLEPQQHHQKGQNQGQGRMQETGGGGDMGEH